MSNLVIVAIPGKDDPVWKVSTEKVPHLTLLFLGEMTDDDGDLAEDTQRIVDFVEHAVNTAQHGQFMMDVDYRDTLGPDEADVLFFKKNGWSSKWITQFRSQLLQQDDIKTAYDANPQYEPWTPHLTLGYPTAPAKDDAIEYPISWVSFDKIAVWTGDYEGPEFRLEWPERDNAMDSVGWSDVAERGKQFVMSHATVLDAPGVRQRVKDKLKDIMDDVDGDTDGDVALFGDPIIRTKLQSVLQDLYGMGLSEDAAQSALEEGLAHYGVKGMKWGVRKEDLRSGVKSATRTTGRAAKATRRAASNANFGRKANSSSNIINLVNVAAHKTKTNDLPGINAKYKPKGAKVSGEVHLHSLSRVPVQKAYREEVKAAYLKNLNASASEMKSKTGDRQYEIRSPLIGKTSATRWRVKSVAAAHDALTDEHLDEFDIIPQFDEDGYIVDFDHETPIDAEDLADGGADESTELVQSVKIGEQFVLEHWGVKGMRWGVRKDRGSSPEPVTPTATSRVPHGEKRKTKIDTQGGENHPAHEDAIRVAKAQAKLKKSGLAALSNHELRDVATRVQLEQQVSLLTGHKGKQFVKRHLRGTGEDLTRQGIRTGLKRAGVAAVLA